MNKTRHTGFAAPKNRYCTPVLFNPYTGEPRDVRDVQSDPQGLLIVPIGAMQLAAPEAPATAVVQVPQGWRFVRRPDGIGIFAPPPKPGESPRTSDTVPASNRDLYDLLGKLADQQAAAEAQPIPAPWREAVKVAREAMVAVRINMRNNAPHLAGKSWGYLDAALAQLDALEGGE